MSNDKVNHPSHYTYGKIECIDFIQDKKLNFCLGNAIKYIVLKRKMMRYFKGIEIVEI